MFRNLITGLRLKATSNQIRNMQLRFRLRLQLNQILNRRTLTGNLHHNRLIRMGLKSQRTITVSTTRPMITQFATSRKTRMTIRRTISSTLDLRGLTRIISHRITNTINTRQVALISHLTMRTMRLTLVALIRMLMKVIRRRAPNIFNRCIGPSTSQAQRTPQNVARITRHVTLTARTHLNRFGHDLLQYANAHRTQRLRLRIVRHLRYQNRVDNQTIIIVRRAIRQFRTALRKFLQNIQRIFNRNVKYLIHYKHYRFTRFTTLLASFFNNINHFVDTINSCQRANIFTRFSRRLRSQQIQQNRTHRLLNTLYHIISQQRYGLTGNFTPRINMITRMRLLRFSRRTARIRTTSTQTFTRRPIITRSVNSRHEALSQRVLLVALLNMRTQGRMIDTSGRHDLQARILTRPMFQRITHLLARRTMGRIHRQLTTRRLAYLHSRLVIRQVSRQLFRRTLRIHIRAILRHDITNMTRKPINDSPVLRPTYITTVFRIRRRMHTRAIGRALTILRINTSLPFRRHHSP